MSAETCPSCELKAELIDDGQRLGLFVCANCKAVADKLDELPMHLWPGNDLSPLEALQQSLPDWMRKCHRELLGVSS